jgi:BTB/POZ domain
MSRNTKLIFVAKFRIHPNCNLPCLPSQRWMYLWNLNSSADKVAGLLEAAEYFQIATLKQYCSRILIRQLSVDNCLEMLDTAYKYNMIDLKRLSADLLVL